LARAGAAGGGQLQQLRERLVAELKLDEAQQARLQAIFDQMRGRFTSLRDLPEEARAKAAATCAPRCAPDRGDAQTRAEGALRGDRRRDAGRSGQAAAGRVWVLADGSRGHRCAHRA
jgi:hypothetical protein